MTRNVSLATLLLLAGCGATAPAQPGGDADPDTCAGLARQDACIDNGNWAACLARQAECAGQVLVLESCPLQFRCP